MDYIKEEITKSFFENDEYTFLKRNLPAAIFISGEDYTSFVEKFQKPYDEIFISAMQETLQYICSNITDCILGYTTEFDMTLILNPPSNIEAISWYSYDITRITSITASMATLKFNKTFEKIAKSYVLSGNNFDETRKFTAMQGYVSAIDTGALFTSKCFNITQNKIGDYIFAQQKHTISNSVYEMGKQYFSEGELADKSASDIQFMVFDKAGKNFDDYPASFRRGLACIKNRVKDNELISPLKKEGEWVIDKEFPLLKPENQKYIDELFS